MYRAEDTSGDLRRCSWVLCSPPCPFGFFLTLPCASQFLLSSWSPFCMCWPVSWKRGCKLVCHPWDAGWLPRLWGRSHSAGQDDSPELCSGHPQWPPNTSYLRSPSIQGLEVPTLPAHALGCIWVSLSTGLRTTDRPAPAVTTPNPYPIPPSLSCHRFSLTPVHMTFLLKTQNVSSWKGFPGGWVVKNPPANAGNSGFIHGSGRSPGEGNGNPLPVSLPGKSHGQRSLAGYSIRGCKESDTTEWLTLFIFILGCNLKFKG